MNRNMIRLAIGILAGYAVTGSTASAAISTYSTQAAFQTAIGSPQITYDFETSAGFPAASAEIGVHDGIDFAAGTYAPIPSPTSGVQAMTGLNSSSTVSTFEPATIDFTGLATLPTGVGFYGLDLADAGEFIRVQVQFATQGTQTYQFTVGSQPAFTPTYFGVNDPADTIEQITIDGSDPTGAIRAWYIDYLTVNNVVPEPATAALSLMTMLGMMLRPRTP